MILDIVKFKDEYLAVHKSAPTKWLGRYYNSITKEEFQHEWSSFKIDNSVHWLIVKASGHLADYFSVGKLILPKGDAPEQVEVNNLLAPIHWVYKVPNLSSIPISDLLAMMNHFESLLDEDDTVEYVKSCWKFCQSEWTKRRIEMFGRCD